MLLHLSTSPPSPLIPRRSTMAQACRGLNWQGANRRRGLLRPTTRVAGAGATPPLYGGEGRKSLLLRLGSGMSF
jgi:hypothetical protein